MNEPTSIIYEFISMGASVKVSAVDPKSGTEVSIVGPAQASQLDLKRVAAAKLRYVMKKAAESKK